MAKSQPHIMIDDEAFERASKDLQELCDYIATLRKDILEMLEDIRKGLDTPAGRKFYQSCYSGLITPLYQQMVVIQHISDNMKMARNMYQPLFDEYNEIVQIMKDSN